MNRVGVQEARANLSELLERVQKGEQIVITKDGVPVAILSAFGASAHPEKVIAMIRSFRKGHFLKPFSVKELIKDGRRG